MLSGGWWEGSSRRGPRSSSSLGDSVRSRKWWWSSDEDPDEADDAGRAMLGPGLGLGRLVARMAGGSELVVVDVAPLGLGAGCGLGGHLGFLLGWRGCSEALCTWM